MSIAEGLRRISIGRGARVSYLTHDGRRDLGEDVDLFGKLRKSGHMSPFEHAARPMTKKELGLFKQPVVAYDEATGEFSETGEHTHFLGNFQGWVQYRKTIAGEADMLAPVVAAPAGGAS